MIFYSFDPFEYPKMAQEKIKIFGKRKKTTLMSLIQILQNMKIQKS